MSAEMLPEGLLKRKAGVYVRHVTDRHIEARW
jgi:hypothetical protein